MGIRSLGLALPIYTTRPSAGDGATATYSQSAWITFAVIWTVSLNIIAWGGIGLYEAVRFII